ncbi:MAG TPA: hypothetical protein VIU61_31115 [Kofleriaceae bacterium]
MIVFSNHRLGPAVELLVSAEVAAAMLRATAEAARATAAARWEQELVSWLEACAPCCSALDVADIAWTPENFERQRQFVLAAIATAADGSEHARPLGRWARMIEAHPRDSVQFGRRWTHQPTA